MFSLPKGTPKVHQVGLKNWQPAVASYQKGCKTTFLIEFAFAQQKIKNEPAHGLIIFFIIDTIATGSRSPAGPRRLRDSDTHKRIAVPKALCVLRERPPTKAQKRQSLPFYPLATQGFRNVRNAPRVVIPPPPKTPPVTPCVPLCAIFLRKPSVYPLSLVKANVGRLCEKLKSAMRNGWGQR